MIPYIINAGLILTACIAFYKLLLQKETFYRLNRFVLLLCLVVAFALPLLPVPQQLSFRKTETPAVTTYIPVDQKPGNNTVNPGQEIQSPGVAQTQALVDNNATVLSWQRLLQWAAWLYWFGVILFALNFLVQAAVLLYRAYTSPVIKDGRFRIVEVTGDKAPCSFANNIFINPEKYDWDTYNQILMHEKIHIQQRHSFDILFAELVLVLQWFNPFAWLYRKEIENNLEFLTDEQLVQKEKVEKKSYQLSLLKVSAPHFPLSLTTNYNQSLLKKRIVMMNAKRSSIHTTWKYFFLLPLLIAAASLLNEPVAKAQNNKNPDNTNNNQNNKIPVNTNNKANHNGISTEGYWFATIKGDKINFRFANDEDDHNSYNNSEFLLSDFPNLPKGTNGDFKLTRDAGTMQFNGKFEGNQGMGRYKFSGDKTFGTTVSTVGINDVDDEDLMTFFFVNVSKDYVHMLKAEGYTRIDKNDLIAVAALKVDKPFIESIKQNGYKEVSLDQLTSFKALGIDGAYIKEIKDAGYKDISTDQLVSFKAQGIDKDYLTKLPKTTSGGGAMAADDVVSLKALNVDEAFANGFKPLGYDDIDASDLVSMKAVGVTPEYVKQFQALGYKDISTDDLVSMKAQNITPEFLKGFEAIGYKSIPTDKLISLKALDVKPEYIKSFKDNGYTDMSLDDAVSMKAQNITPAFIKEFEAIGYKNIDLDDIVALKAVGVTPAWIKDMKAKGFNYDKLDKYITLKSIQ
ncbi:MAG TPA: M56 family metallopeptidase [Parafilimonas sp.]|nr:M56 family metallopeptidase [Parafilimonas sp.]